MSRESDREAEIRAMRIRVAWEVDHIEEASRVHNARIFVALGFGFILGTFLGWAIGRGPLDLGNLAFEILVVAGVAGVLIAIIYGVFYLFTRFAKRLGYPVDAIREAYKKVKP